MKGSHWEDRRSGIITSLFAALVVVVPIARDRPAATSPGLDLSFLDASRPTVLISSAKREAVAFPESETNKIASLAKSKLSPEDGWVVEPSPSMASNDAQYVWRNPAQHLVVRFSTGDLAKLNAYTLPQRTLFPEHCVLFDVMRQP